MVPPIPTAGGKTNRERVEAHTGKGTCGASCHATLINPLGYAFESFDALGKHRTVDNGAPVDTKVQYDGLEEGTISTASGLELSTKLAESPDFHACYLKNWLQYLWSRSDVPEDAEALNDLVKESMEGRSVRDLLLSFVATPSFRRYVP
jgi:hypothetical protein